MSHCSFSPVAAVFSRPALSVLRRSPAPRITLSGRASSFLPKVSRHAATGFQAATNHDLRPTASESGVLVGDSLQLVRKRKVVTQGVHPKGKPVLNRGTAILNLFWSSQ